MGSQKNRFASIIIPTLNRAELLRGSLDSLASQDFPAKNFEVIVIDDGSSDQTASVCRQFIEKLQLRYFYQDSSGIAAAKNLGIFAARGDILIFFDDDDVADPLMVAEHMKTHKAYPEQYIAVLGHTTWHRSLQITGLMDFVTGAGGYLFAYDQLSDGQWLDYTFFWGGRSSCKRSLLMGHGVFNQQFRFGSEDIELGYRLSKKGLKVVFNAAAKSYMVRPITYDEFCRRCERQGKSQFAFSLLHKDPNIQKLCQADQAEERWKSVEASLEHNVKKVHETEELMSQLHELQRSLEALKQQKKDYGRVLERMEAQIDPSDVEKCRESLQRLYWLTFDAFKLKGFAEEKRRYYRQGGLEEGACNSLSLLGVEPFLEDSAGLPAPPPKKAVLLIDLFLPVYDRASGALRTFHILKSLIAMGYHVTFISRYSKYTGQYLPIMERMGIETYAGDPGPLRLHGDDTPLPPVDLDKILSERKFEAAIIAYWDNAEFYLPLIRKCAPDLGVIVDTVDVVFLRKTREAELHKANSLAEEALKNKQREIKAYRQADALWVVTENDRLAIQDEAPGMPIDIIPNIHDHIETVKQFEKTEGLLFVGNFWHLPNVDAVNYFVASILPSIKESLPDAKLHVVGDHVPKKLQTAAPESVIFHGYVPDLSPLLEKARICVAPLRYGAGMKGKIGEALSWGLPVVTTSIGAEGMDLIHCRDVLIGDSPASFAEQTVRLYRDKELWNTLSRNGKAKVSELWSPEAVGRRLTEVFERGVKRRRTVTRTPVTNKPALDPCPRPGQEVLVSILILTYNQLEHTKNCVESIKQHTPRCYEIIFVDNGSIDGTLEYLRGIAATLQNVRVVENRENRGFAGGNNQGLNLAQGRYVLLLNNDTVVTPGWLEDMIAVFDRYPKTGLVGPTSNSVAAPQLVSEVSYRDLPGLVAFASERRARLRGKTQLIPSLIGFCLLMRREVVERIGGLDEIFKTGNFEDIDFCMRAGLAGFELRVAHEVFIHHEGSKSFKNRNEVSNTLSSNWEILKAKWGIPAEIPYGAGFCVDRKVLDRVCLRIDLPDLSRTHVAEMDGRRWRENSVTKGDSSAPAQSMRLSSGGGDFEDPSNYIDRR